MEFQRPETYSTLSGQAQALEDHDRWILAFGITTQHELAVHNISQHPLGDEIDHVILPTQAIVKDTEEGVVEMNQIIFPGYFFFGVNSDNPTWWEIEDDVPEILSFLTKVTLWKETEKIAFLKENDKERIADMIRQIPQHTILNRFAIGDRACVMNGSFTGLYGILVDVNAKKRRAKLDIEIHNSIFPTWISLFDLEVRR